MKARTIAKTGLGVGAALLVLAVGPASAAYASTDGGGSQDNAVDVPCSGSEGGAAGLIAAINAANSGGGGTINLAGGCNYLLTAPDNGNPITGANGLPVVKSQITVKGHDTTIAGNGADFRIFEVDGPSGNLTLQGLTITKGASSFAGGGILNNEGAVTFNHSQVTGNTGAFGGGGIASGVIDPTHLGPIGTLTLNFSQVNANAAFSGGGGGIVNHAGTLTLNHSQVNGNTSAGGGGGIASGSGNGGTAGSSTLILKFSQVNNNTSNGGPMAGAGGIANGGMATISHSQVNNNTAPGAAGGGILNHGTMTINLSEVNDNKAPKDSLGRDGVGGGIANLNFGSFVGSGGVLTINGSDVNNNTASAIGGGILESGLDVTAPLFPFILPGGVLALNHSEVSGNSSGFSGGGIWISAGSPVTLQRTSVRENTPDNCFPPGSIPGCSG